MFRVSRYFGHRDNSLPQSWVTCRPFFTLPSMTSPGIIGAVAAATAADPWVDEGGPRHE